MKVLSKRAQYAALVSLILSIIFFWIVWFLGRWSGFIAVSAASFLILGSALIWAVLVTQFYARSLAEQEKLDMTQLKGDERTSAIFRQQQEQSGLFAVAQRRLGIFEKWFLPAFSLIIAAYQIGISLLLLKTIPGEPPETQQPLICGVYMVVVAFVSFLLCRYTTGMSRQKEWKALRAGGSFMLAVTLVSLAEAVALVLAHWQFFTAINLTVWIVPAFLLILGIETALNFVLDVYRPRLADQYHRSSFDSRFLGFINEPGEMLHTVAGAIDYQFGFKVSQTWFYKLLAKAILPLAIFAVIIVYSLSCLVVIDPQQQVVIERLGNPFDAEGNIRLTGPGLRLKLPWPFDVARKYPTEKLMQLYIGYEPDIDEKTGLEKSSPRFWKVSHYKEEYPLLVAAEVVDTQVAGERIPAVGIINAAVPVQYRIKDLYLYLYKHSEPDKLLESICYSELTRFAAGAKIDLGYDIDIERSLFGPGKARAMERLTKNIQQAADEQQLGVEIVFVGLQGIHPLPKVAPVYQDTVAAVQKKQTAVLKAIAETNESLSKLTGSVTAANELSSLAAQYKAAEESGDTEELKLVGEKLDRAFARAEGKIFQTLRDAQSYAFEKSTLAKATGERFDSQLKAFRAAPRIYPHQQRLLVLEDALRNIRKFIIVPDFHNSEVIIIDMTEKLTPDLYDIGLQENP